MKAVRSEQYGSPDLLRMTEVAPPVCGKSDVLIRVHAAGLHIGDCFAVRGRPLLVRIDTGWFRPKCGIPGYDVAGVVQEVGPAVHTFKAGDRVFGVCKGSCAELATASQDSLAMIPNRLSFTEAAALPTSGLAAFHALRDVAKVQTGQSVLINGASGGVGTFAVQIAKALGAEVTGVCSTRNVSLVGSLGADQVIDYTKQDFTVSERRYDCIFDNVENRSLAEVRRVLQPSGTLICNSGTGASGVRFWIRLLKPLLLSPFTRQKLCRYLSVPNHEDLVALCELVEADQLKPVVAQCHALHEVVNALHQLERGHTAGKRVVSILEDQS
jgi:NADPH:quinone reductase-like Zn-dependent oxidoreductase